MQWLAALPYTVPLLIAALLALGVALFIWRRRFVPGATALMVLGVAAATWSFGYALELSSAQAPIGLFWARMQYLGIMTVPVTWLIFALQYTGNGHWLTRRMLALLLFIPLLTQALVWTNDYHSLIWTRIRLSTSGPFPILDFDHGPGFWACNLFSHLCLLLGSFLLIRTSIRSSQFYLRQVVVVIVGIAAPWIGNALYVLNLSPWVGLDLTPFAVTIAALAIALGVIRFQFLDIVPIARHSVLEGMNEGVIVLDSQNRIVDINPAATQALDRAAREIIGKPITEVMVAWPHVIERYRGISELTDELVVERDGAKRFFDVRISSLYDQRRRLRGRLIVWRDISERKRMEEELLQAKEAAESANRAKGAFLANMSHELRTPLSAILGYNQLMQNEARHHQDTRYDYELEAIQNAGSHLLDLIGHILDMAKIEAGKMRLELETFDVAVLVNDVVATVRPLAMHNENTLDVCFDGLPGMLYADMTKTRQILFNLLSNATKFTARGAITLSVAREVVEGKEWIYFAVSDTGIGIDPDHMAFIFKEFTQVDNSNTRRYGGTGLGLAISYRCCRMMGGDIEVKSVVGQGSTFTARLPTEVTLVDVDLPANVAGA